MDLHAVAREVAASARALEAGPGFPADDVGRARAAAGALNPFDPPDDDVVPAVRLLQMHAGAAPGIRTAATSWSGRSGRRLVGRLVDWYLHFHDSRAEDIARAAARLGPAVVGRLERIEGGQVAGRERLRTEVADLQARVAELENRLGAGQVDGSGPLPVR